MLITADQLLCHVIGDYVFQSEWMATEKTKKSRACLAHVLTYALPFWFLRPSPLSLFVIVSTHFVIDRWRLARYVVWLKNFVSPRTFQKSCLPNGDAELLLVHNLNWFNCSATGYPPTTPPFLAVWLLIITDNIMHVVINGLALKFL